MKALIAIRIRRLGFAILITASFSCVLAFASPRWSVAKTRPPIEMGDPDATGNQATVPGPPTSIAATKPSMSVIVSSYIRAPKSVGLTLVGLTVRRYLSFWFRGLL